MGMEHPASGAERLDLSTAVHEAGHVAAHLYFGVAFVEVSIAATGLYEGRVLSTEVWHPPDGAAGQTLRYDPLANHLITIKLAGPAARARYWGRSSADPGDYTDRSHALAIVDQMFTTREAASRQAFIEFKIREAFDFVGDKDIWGFITLLARELVKNKTLSYARCHSLFPEQYVTPKC